MHFSNLAIPMRAQPFHFGHERYIKRLSLICDRGVIFLNRKIDKNNPYPVSLRQKWIENFLAKENVSNIIVAERTILSSDTSRLDEYKNFFHSDASIVIVTTYETDEMYKKMGFKTFNHHDKNFHLWDSSEENFFSNHLDGYGRIIRNNFIEGKSCIGLISKEIESEAKHFLKSNPL